MSHHTESKTYHHDENHSLSTAILQTIGEYKGEDVTKSDFQLYNDIDPDALNNIFKQDATPGTKIQFLTDSVAVQLCGDGAINIHVTDQEHATDIES